MNTRTSSQSPVEELPYVVELWQDASAQNVERVLGRATSLKLAHAILRSAEQEYPGRRVTLRNGAELITELAPQVSSA